MNKTTHPYFVANGDSRQETAVLLVGTADEFGIDQRDIRTARGGFLISEALAEALDLDTAEPETEPTDSYDPADYNVGPVKEFVEAHPDLAADILASEQSGEDRTTLVSWLNDFIENTNTSGNRAGENKE